MLNLKKSLKLAGVLAIALAAAAPAMTSAASAAPARHYDVQRVAQNDRGFGHARFEHRHFEQHVRWHRHHEFGGHRWR
ncbi:MAG TPA: hypothetical protein VIJ85_07530 [Rhizomicrobium sp.]